MNDYFVIQFGEDAPNICKCSEEQLNEMLEDFLEIDTTFWKDFPSTSSSFGKPDYINYDMPYVGKGVIIIKGKIIHPKKDEVVTKYKIVE